MYSNMITDEDVEFEPYNIQDNSYRDSKDQYMIDDEEEEFTQESDVYQQLAEKDQYLMLAAEAGKVLLEKNQELSNHYQSLQEEYLGKIEELEQERHHLRRELCDRENLYDSRMQDLQHEMSSLSGQLDVVQRSSKSFENSHKSTFSDLTYQNNSLLEELDEVKSYNQNLAEQVQTLSKRIDGRMNNGYSSNLPIYDNDLDGTSNDVPEIDALEMKNLKEQVRNLNEHKQHLEESLTELTQEKQAITFDQKQTTGKVSTLEDELIGLKQQISMCQEDLNKTKRKNGQLKDQLEEYVMLQQSSKNGSGGLDNSLFNELEMSLSEADMNIQQDMSTPYKIPLYEDDDHDLPNILISQTNEQSNNDLEKLKKELVDVYGKLKLLRNKLSDGNQYYDEAEVIDGNTISKLVDQVIALIQDKVLSLGVIDARSNSPSNQLDLDNVDNSDNLSQAGSQCSDRDVDILEQQVHDLNQRLNIATSDLDTTKKDLIKSQACANDNEEKALALTVQVNSQEREIDALRKEREIMMADTTVEEKLKKVLEERDEALRRENEIKAKYETTQNDMHKLNSQLISAVEQKLELSEQLEQWQFDMASLIDQQLTSKIKKESQKSRKRASNTNPARSFAAKFFASKNNSREASQTSTPTMKSPVPPRQ